MSGRLGFKVLANAEIRLLGPSKEVFRHSGAAEPVRHLRIPFVSGEQIQTSWCVRHLRPPAGVTEVRKAND